MKRSNLLPFRPRRAPAGARVDRDEEARLDRLLADPDPELLASLAADDRRRRRRAGWRAAGVGTLVCALLWPASPPPPAETRAPPEAALLSAGEELFQAGRPEHAAASFERAVELAPDSARAWNGLGWAHLVSGRRDAAEAAFARCLALDGEHPAAHNGLGQLAFKRGDFRRAAGHWRRLPVARQLAAALLLAGAWSEAGRGLRTLRAEAPDDELLQAMAAAAEARRLDHELAAILADQRFVMRSRLAPARAWSLYYRERYADAARRFARLVATDGDDLDARTGLGFALLGDGRLERAERHFAALLERDPEHRAGLNGLALCYRQRGRLAQAIAVWERLAARGRHSSATSHLPFAYLDHGQPRKALEHFLTLTARYPENARARDGLRRALAALGA